MIVHHRLWVWLDLHPIRHLGSAGARFVAGLSFASQSIGYYALDPDRLTLSYIRQSEIMPLDLWAASLLLIGFAVASSAGHRFAWHGRMVSAVAVAACVLFAAVWAQTGTAAAVARYLFWALFFAFQAAYIAKD